MCLTPSLSHPINYLGTVKHLALYINHWHMVGIPIMPFSLVFAELLSHSLYYAECKGTRKAEHKVKSEHANASLAPQGFNTNYEKNFMSNWMPKFGSRCVAAKWRHIV